jgi:GDP-4-dehydro-6-deoxy-D-mannose reductase
MNRLLVTGSSGFVGMHILSMLKNDFEIYGASRSMGIDMMDLKKLTRAIDIANPDYIIHLASQSSVGESWKNPTSAFINNTCIFLNLIDAVRSLEINPRILSVGSSEQYGFVLPADLPIKESHPMNPTSPYAIARVAQEQLALLFASSYGLDIVCTRSFNHCGINQDERFVIPSIVEQFRKGSNVIRVGNKNVVRDFIDVRDVVDAYRSLLQRGKSGEVYNICSGEGRSIEVITRMISEQFGIEVDIIEDKTNARPTDNPAIIGCNDKMRTEIGWKPKISFEQSLRDICRCE